MSPSAVALTMIFGIVLLGSVLGFYAGTRRKMSLEQWTVGGRQFGMLFAWLLAAGEIYTAFSFLGASGWVYSRGGPALYIFAYVALGQVVAFYVLPPMWELGRKHGLQTLPDFFAMRYRSRYLAAFVAVIGVAFIVPYLQLQLTGLGYITEVASFGGIGRTPAMVVAVALITGFVLMSGIRAVAWVSVLKDFLMIVAVVTMGIAIPHLYFGGIGHMFAFLARTAPQHLVMPGATHDLTHSWFISTVLLAALGGCVWPHNFGTSFAAKSADVVRRNCAMLPIYTLSLAFVFFAGFAAFVVVPGLGDGDLALLTLARHAFPPWVLGMIGGAGALTAMVPAAILVLTAATLFAKNLFRPMLAPAMTDQQVARLARITVIALSLLSLYFALHSSTTLVSLLLLGYAGVAQFFPGVVLGLFWGRVKTAGVFGGLIAGIACTAILVLGKRDPFDGVSAGFIALCINFAVTVIASLLLPVEADRRAAGLAEMNP